MKKLSLLIVACLPVALMGQKVLGSKGTALVSYTADVDLVGGIFKPYLEPNLGTADHIQNIKLSMENGNIVVTYVMQKLGKEDKHYNLRPEFRLDGKLLKVSPYKELRGDWGNIQDGVKTLIWINPLERSTNLKGTLVVSLYSELWGMKKQLYDCSKGEPTFTGKQKFPYIAAAVVGATSIGFGQMFKNQSEEIYNEEYKNSNSYQESLDPYERANDKNKAYFFATYGGAAILVADAILFTIRQAKYRRNVKAYENTCLERREKRLSLAPNFYAPSFTHPKGATGMAINISF